MKKCKQCGCRRKPKLGEKTFRHPKGGHTVLGQRVEINAIVEYSECPMCGYLEATGLSLPLDPDAELVREAFNQPEPEEREAIYAYLRAHKVTHVDLEELIRLKKGVKDMPGLAALSEWFTKRGMIAPDIVVAENQK